MPVMSFDFGPRATSVNPERRRRMAIAAACVAAIPGIVTLAVLDKIIGPW